MSRQNFLSANVLKTIKPLNHPERIVYRSHSSQLNFFAMLDLHKVQLSVSVGLLLFLVACGSSSNTVKTPPVSGNFSNASLNGSYAFTFKGTNVQSNGSLAPFAEAGVFTADGNGNLTAGTVDFMQSTFGTTTFAGTYSLNNDGTGTLTLNFTGGTGGIQFTVTLIDTSHLYLIETDGTSTGVGLAEKQDTTAFAAPPAGTFVFHMHANLGTVGRSNIGIVTSTGGVVSGNEDVLNQGTLAQQLTLTGGTFSSPSNGGRAALLIQDSSGGTGSNFEYYVVNANTFIFLETDPGVLAVGRAEKQSPTSFANASLKGGLAFGSSGDTNASGAGAIQGVGAFTADGAGNITAGSYDSVQDTNVNTLSNLTGAYAVAANGRATANLNLNGATQEIFWMVSPSRAFFLVNNSSRVEDGTVDQQQGASFSNASLTGQYAIVMDGADTTSFVDRVGTLKADGSGNLTLNETINRLGVGVSAPGFLAGTYSASANGRVTGSISSVSNGLVFYIVSSGKAYLLQTDQSAEISGQIGLQP